MQATIVAANAINRSHRQVEPSLFVLANDGGDALRMTPKCDGRRAVGSDWKRNIRPKIVEPSINRHTYLRTQLPARNEAAGNAHRHHARSPRRKREIRQHRRQLVHFLPGGELRAVRSVSLARAYAAHVHRVRRVCARARARLSVLKRRVASHRSGCARPGSGSLPRPLRSLDRFHVKSNRLEKLFQSPSLPFLPPSPPLSLFISQINSYDVASRIQRLADGYFLQVAIYTAIIA